MNSFFNPTTQSFSVGITSAFCAYIVDTLTIQISPITAPILTFAASTYCALFYLWPPTESDDEKVSFKNYKINYGDSLGGGAFGQVYGLIPRPENEKGCLSNLFPYLYDYFFPVKNDTHCKRIDDKYCVKIQTVAVGQNLIGKNRGFFSLIQERFEEKESNRILRNHKMTNIKFYTSNCLFSQIKTRIHGKTLGWHLIQNSLIAHENYIMREKFVLFYRSFLHSSLQFSDIKPENIMYDEREKKWEIIDGTIVDPDNTHENIAYKISKYINSYDRDEINPQSFDLEISGIKGNTLLELLREVALSKNEYTKVKDEEILKRCAKSSGPPSLRCI